MIWLSVASLASKLDRGLVVIVGAALLLTLPCLIFGFPFYGDDSISNLVLYRQFTHQFWSGELYPRWLQQLNGGLGNPTGFYYPPLPYWITGFLKFADGTDSEALKQLGLSASLALITSGLAFYCWLRRSAGPRAALVGSLAYLVLPYHAAIDIYTRGALAETWTFVWMPLVLWSIDGLFARSRHAVVALATSYAALALTHLPTTVIFSPLPIAYSLYFAPVSQRMRALLLTVGGIVLGAGLAAIYLIPALSMQEFIFHTTEGIGGHYYFGNWFLFTQLKWTGRGSEYFFAATGAMLLALLAFAALRFGQPGEWQKQARFWFAAALCAFLMMTSLSRPIWQFIITLQKVQFPFRFNTILSLAVASVVAFGFSQLRKQPRGFRVALITISLLLCASWIYQARVKSYYSYPIHYRYEAIIDSANKRLQVNRDTNEFRPRWVVSIEQDELAAMLQRIGQTNGELTKVRLDDGDALVAVEKWTPREIQLTTDTPTSTSLIVSQFYFPGWSVHADDAAEPRAVEPSIPGGLIKIEAPAGHHRLTLLLRKRVPELMGEIVSAVSLLLIVVLFFLAIRRNAVASRYTAETH